MDKIGIIGLIILALIGSVICDWREDNHLDPKGESVITTMRRLSESQLANDMAAAKAAKDAAAAAAKANGRVNTASTTTANPASAPKPKKASASKKNTTTTTTTVAHNTTVPQPAHKAAPLSDGKATYRNIENPWK